MVSVHGHILRALLGPSRWWLVGMGFLMVAPVVFRWAGMYDVQVEWGPDVVPTSALSVTAAIGFFLGLSTIALLRTDVQRLLPGHRSGVLVVAVSLGLLCWACVVWSYNVSGVIPGHGLPWRQWVPLWSYGSMGLGFLAGAFTGNTAGFSRRQYFRDITWSALVIGLPWALLVSTTTQYWLNIPLLDSRPGVTPFAVACLLLGPLTWPAFTPRQSATAPPPASAPLSAAERMRSGVALLAWGLLPSGRPRPGGAMQRWKILVLTPQVLSFWTFALGIVLPAALVFPLLGYWDYQTSQAWYFDVLAAIAMVLTVQLLAPFFSAVLDIHRSGVGLLLPTTCTRHTLPHRLFAQLVLHWMVGAFVRVAPLAALVVLASSQPSQLAWLLPQWLYLVLLMSALVFWRVPAMGGVFRWDPVVPVVGLVLMLALYGLNHFAMRQAALEASLAWICAALIVPAWLYHQGLRRWRAMEYGV